MQLVGRICQQVGPGIPYSPQERVRAMILKQEMEGIAGQENVRVQEFEYAPGGFVSVQALGSAAPCATSRRTWTSPFGIWTLRTGGAR